VAYCAFLRGPNSKLAVHTPFARHRQTFKTREYVTFEPTGLRVGSALDAFLPEKPTIEETPSGIEIEGVEYLAAAELTEVQKEGKIVHDVIIFGQVTVYRAQISFACLRSCPTGTFLVGTISRSRPREAVRRVGQLPQGLCTSHMHLCG
jgi:hypothetical protein